MSLIMRWRREIVSTIGGFVLEARPNGQTPRGHGRSSWNHWRPSAKDFQIIQADALAKGMVVAPLD
jgi:hypothetical protein